MKVICAWCQKPQPDKDPCNGKWAYVVTHTICQECLDKEIAALKPSGGGANPAIPPTVSPPDEPGDPATDPTG